MGYLSPSVLVRKEGIDKQYRKQVADLIKTGTLMIGSMTIEWVDLDEAIL